MGDLQMALTLMDRQNSQDPEQECWNGRSYPKELLYSERMTAWLERMEPDPSDLLRIAARGQHICRWMIPRDRYPRTRVGYLSWRTGLYTFHADKVAEIMRQAGYGESEVDRVRKILQKRGLKRDPQVQLIEDVACLVFLESYFSNFAKKNDPSKLIPIVRKTWRKMSERARRKALALELPASARALLENALTKNPDQAS